MNILHAGKPGQRVYVICDTQEPWKHETKPGAVTYNCATVAECLQVIAETALLDFETYGTKTFTVDIEAPLARGPINWELKSPLERLKQLEREAQAADARLIEFRSRILEA